MTVLTDSYSLNDGVNIPKIGFGTWEIPAGEVAYDSVSRALEIGYRHIDTAYVYGNEKDVGRAVRHSGLERKDIFVTSKLPAERKGRQESHNYFERTLDNLGLDYLDLYLIHAPRRWGASPAEGDDERNVDTWAGMEEIRQSGQVRSIGISNFSVHDMQNILDHGEIRPSVNQIRYFVGYTEPDIVQFAGDHQILIEAYSPLARGRLIGNSQIQKIADRYGVTVAQLSIRYCLQNGTLPLPRSTKADHISSNSRLEFTISDADMDYLNQLSDIA